MTNSTRLEMHQDHTSWKKEDDTWRDDMRAWEQEAQNALTEFAQVRAAFAKHLEDLRKHAAAVRLYEMRCEEHEKAIAAHERGSEVAHLKAMNDGHEREAYKHEDLRTAHELLKQIHRTRIAHWNSLLKALEA